MTPRRRGVAVALLAGILASAACAPVTDPGWMPPSWPVTDVRVVDDPAQPLDPAAQTSLTPQRLSHPSIGLQARMVYLPGREQPAATFNAHVDGVIRAAIAQQEAATGVTYAPVAHAPGAGLGDRGCVQGSTLLSAAELLADATLGPPGGSGTAVVCDVVQAAGELFGVRMRVVTGTPQQIAADATSIVYVDTATGEVFAADRLWTDAAADALRDDVVEALRRASGALSLAPMTIDDELTAVIRTALATTVPGQDGTLQFTLPAGFTTPELDDLHLPVEPRAIEVSAALVESVASPFGQRVAAASGTPYAGPAAAAPAREWGDCRLLPCVAVTFDDGPSGFTERLLDDLAEARAAATFYLIGRHAADRRDTVRRAADDGHEIGGHTWDHPSLPSLPDDQIASQLSRTHAVLREITGRAVTSFRPPYGEYDARVLAVAGLPAILWSVDTRDWAGPADDVLLARAVEDARPGGIVLLHDSKEASVRLTPAIIEGLRDRGFTLVTVTELFHGALPSAGAWRFAA